jgi:putative flippase GtrA
MSDRLRSNPAPRTELLATLSRFSLVGVAATVTYFAVANTLMASGVIDASVCSVLAYLVGMVVSFLGQSRLTFRVRYRSWRHFVRFVILSAAGLTISYLSVICADVIGIPVFWATVATSAAIPALSFTVMHLWVFTEPDAVTDTGPRRL